LKRKKKFLLLPTDKIGFIQGDGIDSRSIQEISEAILSKGWSIANCSFGSGGALLQKVNRDTQECAFKCSKFLKSTLISDTETTISDSTESLKNKTNTLITHISDKGVDVAKSPIGEEGKQSKSGVLALVKKNLLPSTGVYSNLSGNPTSTMGQYTTVDIKKYKGYNSSQNILKPIFINGKFIKEDNKFDDIISNVKKEEVALNVSPQPDEGGSRKRYRRHCKRHSRKLKKHHTKKRYPKRRRHRRRSRKHRY
jgi:nicotinic acid phosphoribosyltransferase